MIFLREITDEDLELTMAWRSNPLIYRWSFLQKESLSWEEHYEWNKSRNKDARQFLIILVEECHMRRVGLVTISQFDSWCPAVGYLVGEVKLWGKGVGKEAVNQCLNWVKQQGKEYCSSTIKDDNERSIRLIKSLGFERAGHAREGESWYLKKL